MNQGIYVVSKIRHAALWRGFRKAGAPIISSWIDDPGPEEMGDFSEAWPRYLNEASRAAAVVVYVQIGERLKGGLFEIGAALAGGATVYVVGDVSTLIPEMVTLSQHDRVVEVYSLTTAMMLATETKKDPSQQKQVGEWVVRSFGKKSFETVSERAKRVLEEAIELAQASGVPQDEAAFLLNYVYSRAVGEISQELAGVSTTLLAFAESQGLDLEEITRQEVARVLSFPTDYFKQRLQRKVDAGVAIAD